MKNDKFTHHNLLEPRTPNENDLQNFEKWKQRKRSRTKHTCIILFIFTSIMMFMSISFAQKNSETITKLIFPVLLFFVFIISNFSLIFNYLKIKKSSMEYCNYGTVIDKQIVARKKYRKYLITVSSNGNTFREDAQDEFSSLNVGDEVIVFTIHGKKRIYFSKIY